MTKSSAFSYLSSGNLISRFQQLGLLTLLMSFSMQAYSFKIGEGMAHSRVGKPLSMDIELYDLNTGKLDIKYITVGSQLEYDHFGAIKRPEHHNLLFGFDLSSKGKPIIKVITRDPYMDPYLDFVVAIKTKDHGSIVKRITSKLQPSLKNPGLVVNTNPAVSKPVMVRNPEPAKKPVKLAVKPKPQYIQQTPINKIRATPAYQPVKSQGSGEYYGPVKPGDQLGLIAQQFQPEGVSLDKMMVAIFKLNPYSFNKNIHDLNVNSMLYMPTISLINEMSLTESKQFIHSQLKAFKGHHRAQHSQNRHQLLPQLRKPTPKREARQSVKKKSSGYPHAGAVYPRIKKTDILGAIARRYRPRHVSLDQMIVAIFNRNQSAFHYQNMNLPIKGKSLTMPEYSAIIGIDKEEAHNIVDSHYAKYQSLRKTLNR